MWAYPLTKKKEWPTSCRLSILNWHFRVTHPLAPFFCSRSEAYSQFPCMSHKSRGKGQRVAIRWMRRPINVLIWIILLSAVSIYSGYCMWRSIVCAGGSYFETHKLIPFRFEACLNVVPFSHCHERIQTARDRTTLRPDEKESAIFALPWANSNSQGPDNPRTGRKGEKKQLGGKKLLQKKEKLLLLLPAFGYLVSQAEKLEAVSPL